MRKRLLVIGIMFFFFTFSITTLSSGFIDNTTILRGEAFNLKKFNYNNLIEQMIENCIISSNKWLEEDKLLPSDGAEFENFGESVSIDGDTALIGKPCDDDNGHWSGSAYVFIRSGTNWTQQAKLLPSDGADHDWFGLSVSIDGDTAIIGKTNDDDNGFNSGSAYIFTREDTTWTQQAKLLPSDGEEQEYFGHSVSIDGNTALISTIHDDDNGNDSGSAYIFTREDTTWTQQAKLLPSDGEEDEWFGFSVSIDGDTAIIGKPLDDDNGYCSGSAYIFTRSGTTWTQQAKLLTSDGIGDEHFGRSVSIDGDTALIGAYGDSENAYFSGSAYIFTREDTTWTQQAKLLSSDGTESDHFSWSVSIDGNTALIGTHYDDDNGNNSGSAYIFSKEGENQPPNNPVIDGSNRGDPGILYDFTFNAVDPDGDDVKYIIKWGDETKIITDFNKSGNDITLSHKWYEAGTYIINAKAQDKFGSVGPETIFTVTIPRDKAIQTSLFLNWLQSHPNLLPILQKLLQPVFRVYNK